MKIKFWAWKQHWQLVCIFSELKKVLYIWCDCRTVLRPWGEEEEYAGSKGKCPPQAHPPLSDHYRVLETSEILALTVSAKFTSILRQSTPPCVYPSAQGRLFAEAVQNSDAVWGTNTHTHGTCHSVGPRVGREGDGWAYLSVYQHGPQESEFSSQTWPSGLFFKGAWNIFYVIV